VSSGRQAPAAGARRHLILLLLVLALAAISCTSVNYDRREEQRRFNRALTAARGGDSMAQYVVGEMFGKGEGTGEDCEEALVWIGRAADGGEPQAQLTLGTLMCQGYCGHKDIEAGLSLLRESGVNGAARVRKAVARALLRGTCAERSRPEAWAWMVIAGDAEANEAAQSLYERMTAAEQSEAELRLSALRARIAGARQQTKSNEVGTDDSQRSHF